MNNEEKPVKESDFHHDTGTAVPFIIKFTWTTFTLVALAYLWIYMVPALKSYLNL